MRGKSLDEIEMWASIEFFKWKINNLVDFHEIIFEKFLCMLN